MNDFTKEELEHIHYALTEYGNFESAPVEKLGEKIQSMIDDYCENEHQSDGNLYTRLGPAPYTMSMLRVDEHKLFKNNRTLCIKCGEYYIL